MGDVDEVAGRAAQRCRKGIHVNDNVRVCMPPRAREREITEKSQPGGDEGERHH